MERINTPTQLVIVGVTGDLSKRKLLPAIEEIARAGLMPEDFSITGLSRRDVTVDDVLGEADFSFVREHLDVRQLDMESTEAFAQLKADLDSASSEGRQRLFYLSVPPTATEGIIERLGDAGLLDSGEKLLLEKPFGYDLPSAERIIEDAKRHADESQLYRIDHYLAKEMTQNLLVFRSFNPLFERTWNADFIDKIDIIASEKIGIEGRGDFYEQTGALRDLVQSHLLQLAALTLLELPEAAGSTDWRDLPERRQRALERLRVTDPPHDAIRGQYQGYRDEAGNPSSSVETFAAISLHSDDPRWNGVPIRLITGKALEKKLTEIRITYKAEHGCEPNVLSLRISPHDGIDFTMWAKRPGYARQMEQTTLSFAYHHTFEDRLAEAYEQVFVDALRSDHSLFTTSEEVLASWRILAPIQQSWQNGDLPLLTYPQGAGFSDVLDLASSATSVDPS